MNSSPSIQKIAEALSAAQAEFKTVGHSGENKFDHYSYAKLEDYVRAVKPVLASHGLSAITSVEDVIPLEDRTTAKGGREHAVRVKITLRIVHISGEWIDSGGIGEGQDRADKAVYKAITGARKYALASALGLATSDDPEADEGTGQTPPPKAGKAPAGSMSPADQQFVDTYSDLMNKRGCKTARAHSILRTMLEKKGVRLADVPPEGRETILEGVREGKWDQFFAPPKKNKAA